MADILFKTDDYVFSYRVAGICVQNSCVLLQRPTNDSGYAFPGGHVAFGATNAETLVREFKEELGADIAVRGLKWVSEVFFPWGDKPCHQICLYYAVELLSPETPRTGSFSGTETLDGQTFTMGFHWVPLEALDTLEVYPTKAAALLKNFDGTIQHFVDRDPAL